MTERSDKNDDRPSEKPNKDIAGSTGQKDDNIDDLGRKPDGTTQDQPGTGAKKQS